MHGGVAAFTVTLAAPEFLSDLARAQGGRTRNLVILNLSGVRALDASGLGGLAATLRLVREVGGELKVVAGSAAINELLRRTHLSVALPAVASEADAIASFETAKV